MPMIETANESTPLRNKSSKWLNWALAMISLRYHRAREQHILLLTREVGAFGLLFSEHSIPASRGERYLIRPLFISETSLLLTNFVGLDRQPRLVNQYRSHAQSTTITTRFSQFLHVSRFTKLRRMVYPKPDIQSCLESQWVEIGRKCPPVLQIGIWFELQAQSEK